MFGSKDSIMTVFQRTLAYNDPKKMYMHLGYLLGQNGSHELAEEVFADTLKKVQSNTSLPSPKPKFSNLLLICI